MTNTLSATASRAARAFCFDPWECYQRLLTHPAPLVSIGHVGTGQSMSAKAYAVRESAIPMSALRWKVQ
jgi:hypothetical protein